MNPKLLLVDDNPAVLEALERLLTLHGFKVLSASNGTDAIWTATQVEIDAALVDLVMPGLDGLQVCRTLKQQAKQQERAVPVWIMTGALSADIVARAAQVGAEEVLEKPFDSAELSRKLSVALKGNGASAGARLSAPVASRLPGAVKTVGASLTQAIRGRLIITFEYTDESGTAGWRKVEPHVLGESRNGQPILLGYQVNGTGLAASALPWKTYQLDRMRELVVSAQPFGNPRPGYESALSNLVRMDCMV